MIHELNIQKRWFDRIATDEQRVVISKHDRDFQAGDEIHLFEANERGNRISRWVDSGRDERGRFTPSGFVTQEPLRARITHVLPASQSGGITVGDCALSIEVQP